jgi:hypothetical protein
LPRRSCGTPVDALQEHADLSVWESEESVDGAAFSESGSSVASRAADQNATLWVPRTRSPHLTSSFAACDTATTAYGRDRHDRSPWPFDSVT